MLNFIWLALVLLSITISIFNGTTGAVVASLTVSAEAAIKIALGLIGIMALWLGIMRIAELAGLIQVLGRLLAPALKFLFPSVPKEDPAMGSMVMNISANMLGLGNAATPMGLRAMAQLQKLNPFPKIASNPMCTFLAINTSSVQLIPATAIAILAANGDPNPTSIVFPVLIATMCSTTVAITAVKILEKLPLFRIRQDARIEVK